MSPGIRPGETPPFHLLGEYVFQDLCRDLFDHEASVSTCDIYGVRGERQDGIDLLGHRRDGNGVEVGQCKCCSKFSKTDITKASDKFFACWDQWSQKNVKRFILFVACDLDRRKQQDEIIKQKARFAKHGIRYEAWSGAKIRNKLRPYQSIVATYCKPADYWLQEICGATTTSAPGDIRQDAHATTIVQTALITQVDRLSSRLANDTDRRIEQMRAAWREGREAEVANQLKGLKGDSELWQILPPETKARVLRFEASWVLDRNDDIVQAKQLADEAQSLDPSQNQARLRAIIAYREDGPEAALKLLDGQNDLDSLNLKAALLVQIGRIQEARAVLQFAGDSDGGN